MTLTEFLLARIAEDEEFLRAQRISYGSRPLSGPLGEYRLEAECEVKRHLFEMWWHSRPHDDDWYRALQIIALAYAHHPDYDEAWRPRGGHGIGRC